MDAETAVKSAGQGVKYNGLIKRYVLHDLTFTNFVGLNIYICEFMTVW